MQLGHIASKPFQELLNKLATASLPIASTLKVRKLLKQVGEEVKEFDAVKQTIAQEYGKKNEDGTPMVNDDQSVPLDETRAEEWTKKINDLVAHEVELPKLKLADLGAKLELNALELSILELVLED